MLPATKGKALSVWGREVLGGTFPGSLAAFLQVRGLRGLAGEILTSLGWHVPPDGDPEWHSWLLELSFPLGCLLGECVAAGHLQQEFGWGAQHPCRRREGCP